MATVDFSGNIGGISHYGRLAYGSGPYSRIRAFQPDLAADLDLVGTSYFDGDLAASIDFAGVLGFDVFETGDLAFQVTFAATELTLDIGLAGDLSPQIDLGAPLSLDVALGALDGSFGFTVVYEASSMISGPLWGASTPCPPSMWTPVEPCDAVEWEASTLCNG
jgi:hypothetical protein